MAIAALLLSPAAVSIYAQSAVPDTIFVGEILTLDRSNLKAEAMAVSAGRIVAIGSRSEVEALATQNTRKVTINGVALPGFADAHIHVAGVGEQLEKLNLRGLTKAEILAKVADAARTSPSESWITAAAGTRASGIQRCFQLPKNSTRSAAITRLHLVASTDILHG